MRYLILGPLEVRDGDRHVELRGGRQRKLLAILVLHSGEAVSTDRLIEELWDGKPPETAVKALQGYVSSLRKQLGPETIGTVGTGYRLIAAPEDTDAGRFEELLAEARPLERAPAAAKLREALGLWRGPALADFAYDEFARSEIDRLEDLRLTAVERRIDLELALGHHDDLAPELEALVRAHPLRERFRGQLMVALYRSGRQADALDAYRDARTVMREELGLEPSEELQALQRAILAHDATLAAPPRVDPPGPPDPVAAPRGRRLPLAAVAIGLALLGGAAVAIVLTQGNSKDASIVVPPNSVAMVDSRGKRVESFAGVGRGPVAIAVGLRGVWVANAVDGTVDRLDPATGKPVATIGVGADLYGVAVGFGSVWVADGNDGTVTRIDPRINRVETTIPPREQPTLAPAPVFYIAVDSRYVWATRGDELLRINPSTNRVDGHVSIGIPTGLTTGGGYVWVTTQGEQLLRIDGDARNMKEAGSQNLSGIAFAPVYARGTVWVIVGEAVRQVERFTLSVGDPVNIAAARGEFPVALAAGNAALWVLSSDSNSDGNLRRLVAGGRVSAPLRVGKNLSAVAAGGGATWVAVSATG